MYPEERWDDAKLFVVPGDRRSTWNNLLSNNRHPRIILSISVDFILDDSSQRAVDWFSDFIL